jgi:preprotein translocase subunit SecA
MEDNLMRIFGDPNRTKRLLQIAGMKAGEAIESGMLSRQIEKAQRKVESHNFDIRKQLLTFDDVANDQRKVVYGQRTEILGAEDLSAPVRGMFEEAVKSVLDTHVPDHSLPADWKLQELAAELRSVFHTTVDVPAWLVAEPELEEASLRQRVTAAVLAAYQDKEERYGAPIMRHVERHYLLQTLDQHWRDHLASMDYLRQGIHLRGYAQKDWRYEFKREAFEMFTAMLGRVKFDTAALLSKIEVRTQEQIDAEEAARQQQMQQALQAQHAEAHSLLEGDAVGSDAEVTGGAAAAGAGGGVRPGGVQDAMSEAMAPFVRGERKVGRNEPCPCGSGRKFKHCHGALAADA